MRKAKREQADDLSCRNLSFLTLREPRQLKMPCGAHVVELYVMPTIVLVERTAESTNGPSMRSHVVWYTIEQSGLQKEYFEIF